MVAQFSLCCCVSKWPDLNGVLILIVETTRLRDNMANKQSAQSAKSGVLCGEDIKAHHLITEDTFDENLCKMLHTI